jgi:hypothetical protein
VEGGGGGELAFGEEVEAREEERADANRAAGAEHGSSQLRRSWVGRGKKASSEGFPPTEEGLERRKIGDRVREDKMRKSRGLSTVRLSVIYHDAA